VIDRDRVRDKIAFLRRNLELLHALARTPEVYRILKEDLEDFETFIDLIVNRYLV